MGRVRSSTASWIRNLMRPGRTDRDLRDEVAATAELLAEEARAAGASEGTARRRAAIALGGEAQLEERLRAARFGASAKECARDLWQAGRHLRRRPGFALVAIAVLGLGIGVGTAMYSVLDAVLLRPLPFANSGRLVTLAEPRGAEEMFWQVSRPDILDWRRESRTMAAIAFVEYGSHTVRTGDDTVEADSPRVSENLFATLGVAPRAGRVFTQADVDARSRVTVLSDAFARRVRAGVGSTLRLDGQPYAVIGIMPPGFRYPYTEPVDLWTAYLPSAADTREVAGFQVVGRLAPGATVRGAQAELSGIQRRIVGEFANLHLADRVVVRELGDVLVGPVRPALLASGLVVGLIWLIACSSVAGLMLTRFAARRRELAVRAALGAGRMRLARQLANEGLWIGASAAGLGWAIAAACLAGLGPYLVRHMPFDTAIRLDPGALAAMFAATLVSVLLVSLAPALGAARIRAQDGLNDRSAAAGPAQRRLRDALVVAEIALAVVLLAGAGLFLRTLQQLRKVQLGYTTADIVTTRLAIPGDEFKARSIYAVFEQPLLARIEALPGVAAAAVSSAVPLEQGVSVKGMFGIVGRSNLRPGQQPQGDMRFTSPDYPRVFHIPVERGRFFEAGRDTPTSPPVVVINHALAARYFPGQNPVGQQLTIGKNQGATIIGVLADVRQSAVALPPAPEVHFATTQMVPGGFLYNIGAQFVQLAVRFDGDAPDGPAAIRQAMRQLNPDVAPGDFSTMRQLVERSVGDPTFFARLLGLFGLGALAIALAGLYGLLAYSVAQRTRELGIRSALGAGRGQIARLVLGHAARLLGIGLAAGLGLALALSRLAAAYLYGVSARDPLTLAAAVVLMGAAGLLAAYAPARRAARVSPLVALRSE